MTNQLVCFPFVDGDLQEFSDNVLSDEEKEQVYNDEEIIKEWCHKGKLEIWRKNEEVELTLHYGHYLPTSSGVTFYWFDDNGHKYPMCLKDMNELLQQGLESSGVHAIFTYVKRGTKYGIKFLKKTETEV